MPSFKPIGFFVFTFGLVALAGSLVLGQPSGRRLGSWETFKHYQQNNPSFSILQRTISVGLTQKWDTLSLPDRITTIAKYWRNTPYPKGVLPQVNSNLKPIFCLHQLDCYTLVDNAIALCKAFSELVYDSLDAKPHKDSIAFKYVVNLEKIRYRAGQYQDFNSRLHYAQDLIADYEKRAGWINLTNLFLPDTGYFSLNAISKNLKIGSRDWLACTRFEDSLSRLPLLYIRSERFTSIEPDLLNGDLLFFIPKSPKGIAISHVGILVKTEKQPAKLLHASSQAHKVVLTPTTVSHYLKGKGYKGFLVVRLPEK